MSFLNPLMLAGLAAVAVPILIHLLNRRRFRKVVWAAMRFLKVSVEQNQRRLRLEDLLLLALRCLLVALLALALARPALRSQAAALLGQAKVTGVLILDHSRSMGLSDGARTRFDKAKQAATQVLDALPPGSALAVLLASDTVQSAIPEPTFDLNLARRIVREAPLTDRATDLLPALQQAVDTLRDRPALRKEIYLITDGQALGWRHLAEAQHLLAQAGKDLGAQIILVTEQEERNLGVSDLRLASGLAPARQPLRFEVQVSNYGKEEVRDVRVRLSVNQEPACDECALDRLPAGASRSVSLFAKLPGPGFHSVTARIPEDRLPADDRRTLAVRALSEVRVLLVDGEPGSDPRDSEVFFLRHALTPVAAESAPDYFLKTTVVTAAELAQARLDDFDAVVLANVPDCTEATVRALESYLRRGGGLLLFLGGRVNPTFYNEVLYQRRRLLPAALGPARGRADQDEQFFTLQEKDYEHPIVSIWNDPAAGTLGSARFYRAFELLPEPAGEKSEVRSPKSKVAGSGSASSGPASDFGPRTSDPGPAGPARVIVRYAEGSPAAVERDWGAGRVILFSSTADTAWTDLPVRPAFVPLVHRALGALVQRPDEGLNVRVGARFSRRLPAEFLDKDALFSPPRPLAAARERRRIETVQGWPVLQYEQTDFAGLYEATVTDPPLAVSFAAQADPAESALDELSPAQRQLLQGVARVTDWTGEISLRTLMERARSGVELWLPLALAVLGLALTETFLGQWFSRAK